MLRSQPRFSVSSLRNAPTTFDVGSVLVPRKHFVPSKRFGNNDSLVVDTFIWQGEGGARRSVARNTKPGDPRHVRAEPMVPTSYEFLDTTVVVYMYYVCMYVASILHSSRTRFRADVNKLTAAVLLLLYGSTKTTAAQLRTAVLQSKN